MPLYEYRCIAENCHRKFERTNPFSKSKQDENCPYCNSTGKRIISVPAPAKVIGGTQAGKGGGIMTLGDFNDSNDYIDA